MVRLRIIRKRMWYKCERERQKNPHFVETLLDYVCDLALATNFNTAQGLLHALGGP